MSWIIIIVVVIIALCLCGDGSTESYRGRGRRGGWRRRGGPFHGPYYGGGFRRYAYPPWWYGGYSSYDDTLYRQKIPSADEVCVSVCEGQLNTCLADDETENNKCYEVYGKCSAVCKR